MNQKLKGVVACVLALIMVFAMTVPATAATERYWTMNSSSLFEDSWERVMWFYVDDEDVGVMYFGFTNALLLSDKDYCKTKSLECSSKAGIRQWETDSKIIYNSSYAAMNKWSERTVANNGYHVTYGVTFSATYGSNFTWELTY